MPHAAQVAARHHILVSGPVDAERSAQSTSVHSPDPHAGHALDPLGSPGGSSRRSPTNVWRDWPGRGPLRLATAVTTLTRRFIPIGNRGR